MADLQAAAVAKNLIADLNGKSEHHGFKSELVCIVDSLDSGTLVYRDMKRARLFKAPFMHHLKRLFEWLYLRNYR
jgi:sulfide:quinone oxidoreductase